jgi:uncharacterized protein YdeI (BOF family)
MTNFIKPLFLFIAISLLKTSSLIAQDTKADSTSARDPKKYYLQINSLIKDSKGPDKADEKVVVKGAVIKVINSNNYLVASYFTDKKGKVSFQLPLDKKFKIIIQKKGYVSKIVEVNSEIPKDVNNAFIFGVDIALFAEVKNLNTDVLLKPVAKIKYDKMSKEFNYDISYTHKVNGELKKMYKEYYTLKKKNED